MVRVERRLKQERPNLQNLKTLKFKLIVPNPSAPQGGRADEAGELKPYHFITLMRHREDFEQRMKQENQRDEAKMMQRPGGRRHDAETSYSCHMRSEAELHGFDSNVVSRPKP